MEYLRIGQDRYIVIFMHCFDNELCPQHIVNYTKRDPVSDVTTNITLSSDSAIPRYGIEMSNPNYTYVATKAWETFLRCLGLPLFLNSFKR